MRKVVDVHIGEVKIAKNGEVLKAILGSCVGIGVLWQAKKICGLAHCLLPESPTPKFEIGARFVDQAVRSLVAMMKIRPTDTGEILVVVVGGGNMTNSGMAESELIGLSNFRNAMSEVQKQSLKVLYSEGGGEVGRKVSIDATDFTYRVEKIPRIIGVS